MIVVTLVRLLIALSKPVATLIAGLRRTRSAKAWLSAALVLPVGPMVASTLIFAFNDGL